MGNFSLKLSHNIFRKNKTTDYSDEAILENIKKVPKTKNQLLKQYKFWNFGIFRFRKLNFMP